MLITLIIIFVITALLGIYLLSYVLPDKTTPKGIAMLHGTMGAMGIIVLLIGCFYYPSLIYSLIIFILAALGGTVLFTLDILGKKIPKFLAIGHGLIAISGFIILVWLSMSYL